MEVITNKRNLIAQWAFDTRPVLNRFHLWLEDVEVDWDAVVDTQEFAFVPRGIWRCLAMTSAVTALGTKLFGSFGAGKDADSDEFNQVKKAADAVSAYVMSEGLWQLSRTLPENHAMMICLGEGLMPKGGETPEMGSNPLLGFGRVYARPEVAKFIDRQVHRLLNDADRTFEDFYRVITHRGITIWGAAADTLENTSLFAKGAERGPMSIFHLFNQPLTVSRPYEAYMGSLTIPGQVKRTAEQDSLLIDFLTPREKVTQAVERTYPGIERRHIHVWTLRGKSREARLIRLWKEWTDCGVHLVDDGWTAPTGHKIFCESGTYAPTFMVRDWRDEEGRPHVFICDGYAATAEAMQAASLSDVLDVDVSMVTYSPKFELPHDDEYRLFRLDPDAESFSAKLDDLFMGRAPKKGREAYYRQAIREAQRSNIPLDRRILHCDDFFPEKRWRVLATDGFMCPDPYSGAPGVEKVNDGIYRVAARMATKRQRVRINFTFRLMETLEQSRLVFSPLLVRFTSGEDYRKRAVKVSDSGRIRNELQTLISPALEYRDDQIIIHFEFLDDKVMPRDKQAAIREILEWYKAEHPVWFEWLELG